LWITLQSCPLYYHKSAWFQMTSTLMAQLPGLSVIGVSGSVGMPHLELRGPKQGSQEPQQKKTNQSIEGTGAEAPDPKGLPPKNFGGESGKKKY